ncbi:drebrin-like protein [Nematolebias whitei]|uniref:drebrin-like protein n=1 Tax=Nematolebias whitei TaxID=451745 RepID=UPI001897FBF3|nr:drebrin-like protein [Nematolebias whitei]
MSRQTVNLDTYSLSLLTAKEDILNPRSSTNWALFTYDGLTNKLKLADSGAGNVTELAGKFHSSKPQYGLFKVGSLEGGAPQIVLISWIGQDVEDYRRQECASHIPAIKNFFKEAHAFVSAERLEDVTEEKIRAELSKAQTHAPSQWVRRSSRSADKEEIVGTNYRKTNAAMEMRFINRDSFWACAEREEEERKEEERRRATEERRRLERERVLKERRDEEERDRKMNEKLQMIEEQRRKQKEQEEELRKKEKLRWERQQSEHEDEMRARLRRSESIEKAAEAAALVSQRSMNPREFFRQLSSSSQSPTSPGSSRTGKPFRRYQRSLTDTAFIFSKAEESAATSPRSSPLVSPFLRAPPSPIFQATSPPESPVFHPLSSPQRPRAPTSPATSPIRPAPPSALPSIPQTNNQAAAEPTEPSAPPTSPSLLASLTPSLISDNPSQLHLEAEATSAPNIPAQTDWTLNFEPGLPPQVLADPIPECPELNTDLSAASQVHMMQMLDTGFKVQAVLVEADEEEDVEECDEDKPETQPELCAAAAATAPAEAQEVEEEEREEAKEEEEQEEDQDEEDKEEEEEMGSEEEADPALVEGLETPQDEEKSEEDVEIEHSGDIQPPAEPAEVSEDEEEPSLPDDEPICQEIKHETVILSANGITNGAGSEEHNGTVRSLSPSDTEGSTSELTICYSTAGHDDIIENMKQEISENGQEDSAEQHMCVRALYDYQAEDETEISFEPGDIIRDVETVDKAWWRGWSKDGQQGLFPANYVETI